MPNIKLTTKHTNINKKMINEYSKKVKSIHEELHERADKENDYVGWLNLLQIMIKKNLKESKKQQRK